MYDDDCAFVYAMINTYAIYIVATTLRCYSSLIQ